MILVWAIIAHLWGDYILQSDWMAQNKTSSWVAAIVHGLMYSLPFILLDPSLTAYLTILTTHIIIDRFRLTRYISWARNGYKDLTGTGYSATMPAGLAMALMIIVDNTVHLTVNAFALTYL